MSYRDRPDRNDHRDHHAKPKKASEVGAWAKMPHPDYRFYRAGFRYKPLVNPRRTPRGYKFDAVGGAVVEVPVPNAKPALYGCCHEYTEAGGLERRRGHAHVTSSGALACAMGSMPRFIEYDTGLVLMRDLHPTLQVVDEQALDPDSEIRKD